MRRQPLRAWRRILLGVLFIEIVISAFSIGQTLRQELWEWSRPVRPPADVEDAWARVLAQRLGCEQLFEQTSMLATINLAMALLAVLGVFLLVRAWSIRCDLTPQTPADISRLQRLAAWMTGVRPAKSTNSRPRQAEPASAQPRPMQGCGRGLLAAILFWLNPAMLLDGSVCSQWDIWPMPFFIFALLAAVSERWLLAGMLLAAGAMLKGHMLLVAPLFVLWPLFMNAPRAALRVVIGFFGAAALIAAPWLMGQGALWVVGVALTPVILARRAIGNKPVMGGWIAIPIALELLMWPLIVPADRTWLAGLLMGGLALVLITAGRRLGPQWLACQVLFAAAGALFLCPLLFDGSIEWLKIGYATAAAEFPLMTQGAENLAAILQRSAGLSCTDTVFTIDLPAMFLYHVVTVRELLAVAYGLMLIISGAAAAWHMHRREPGLLVAAVMPWVMFFALLTQMHERYLVWAACLSSLWVVSGLGMTLVHLLLSALASGMILFTLTLHRPEAYPALSRFMAVVGPGMAWVVLLAACMVIFGAVASRKRTIAH